LAFPDYQYTPAELPETAPILIVAVPVALQLRTPVFKPGLRNVRVDTAWVLVPEAATDFNDALEPGENQIGFAWELGHVKPVAIAHPMHDAPHGHFGRRIQAANPPHVRRAAFGSDRVNQAFKLPSPAEGPKCPSGVPFHHDSQKIGGVINAENVERFNGRN
jgi:hypothetical protein